MADVNAPGNGTSEPGAPDNGQGFDFETGYKQLQPEFTRKSQELAEYQSRASEYEQLFDALHDPDDEIRTQAMEALGIELPAGPQGNPEPTGEFVDPLEQTVEELRAQVSELSSAREQEAAAREEQRAIELRDDYIGEAVSFIEDSQREASPGFKFTEPEEKALGNLAIAMTDDEGMPDVQGAYQLLYGDEGVLEINRSRWIDTKSGAAQAPFGRTIPAEQKPKNARERTAYIDERMRALNDQQ